MLADLIDGRESIYLAIGKTTRTDEGRIFCGPEPTLRMPKSLLLGSLDHTANPSFGYARKQPFETRLTYSL